jgi:hypothetical protein
VQERDRILHKFPDLIDQHVEELAMLDTVDAGKLFLVGKVRDIPGARTCSATTPEEGAAAGCAGLRGGRRRRRRWPPWPAAAGRGGAGRVGEVWRQEGVNEWVPQIGVEEMFHL